MSKTEEPRLTTEAVRTLAVSCMFEDEELADGKPPRPFIFVNGITCAIVFDPERLEPRHLQVKELLDELPVEFKAGWSFLNACDDKHGRQWGVHPSMQVLMLLGIAAGWAKYCLPREHWSILPSGMPYFIVLPERSAVETTCDIPT